MAARLPRLPFRTGAFELALVSHLLFLYAEALDAAFHADALREALRVAREVRVLPLLDLDGGPSRHVEPVRAALGSDGVESEGGAGGLRAPGGRRPHAAARADRVGERAPTRAAYPGASASSPSSTPSSAARPSRRAERRR